MAWIESHQELRDHPKTKKLARLLGVSKVTAIGHLHCLWWWALDYADDGDLSRFDIPEIADAAEWEGNPDTFFAAMRDAGFVDGECTAAASDATVHHWDEYAGRLVTRREQNAAKQRAWRERQKHENARNQHVTVTEPSRDGATVPNPTVPNQTEPSIPPTPFSGDRPKKPNSVKNEVPDDLLGIIPAAVRVEMQAEQRMTDQEIQLETLRMIDHFLANGEKRVNWVAAWRNWMRSPYRHPPKLTNGHGPPGGLSPESKRRAADGRILVAQLTPEERLERMRIEAEELTTNPLNRPIGQTA